MLPQDVKPLVDLVNQNAGNEGVLRALLVFLQNAPDSSVVVESLRAVEDVSSLSDEMRDMAVQLLSDCDEPEELVRWRGPDAPLAVPAVGAGNVVSLHAHPAVQALAVNAVVKNTITIGHSITFQDIGGLEDVKSQIRRKIIKPFESPGLFQKFKRRAGGGVLMYGPPGCGKTMVARALANECNARFIEARAADILDMYKGVAEKRIVSLFEQARESKPTVIFFDEVEALAQRRNADSLDHINTVVSALLNEMDGFGNQNEGILFLGATNVPWSLDSAFRRPGRFDRMLFVPPPDRVARRFILKNLLKDRPVEDGLDIQFIVEKTSGYSGADLSSLVEAAVDYAIEDSESIDAFKPLSDHHFKEALREVKSSTGEWLGLAQSYSEYAAKDGLYDDLRAFLKKHA